jgi:hypothetical protein
MTSASVISSDLGLVASSTTLSLGYVTNHVLLSFKAVFHVVSFR